MRNNMYNLTPTLAKIALEELNETPDRIQQDLIILRVWIRQQAHLKARTNDEFLIAFLRRCKYSLEATKKRIDAFFTIYNIFPEFTGNRILTPTILDINRTGVFTIPDASKCENQPALVIIRLNRFGNSTNQLREFLQYFTMVFEIMALENDTASVCGVCKIIDFAGISSERLEYMDRNIPRKWTIWLRDCCPLRFRQVYFVNSPKEIQRLFAIRRTFFSWRSEFSIFLLKDAKELQKHVAVTRLPEEYGGSNGSCSESIEYIEDLLKSYRRYFEEEINYGTDEALREGDVVTYEAEFGACGSFRKLGTD